MWLGNLTFVLLPSNSFGARHKVKMPIAAQQRERVLPAKCRDPEVIGGNRFALPLQFEDDFCVVLRGWLGDIQDEAVLQKAGEPAFIARAVSQLRDSVAVFTQYDHG